MIFAPKQDVRACPVTIASYIILGINDEGKKEVLSITVGENESAKYWLGVLNDLKNRWVQDILILCADGLSGIKFMLYCNCAGKLKFSYSCPKNWIFYHRKSKITEKISHALKESIAAAYPNTEYQRCIVHQVRFTICSSRT